MTDFAIPAWLGGDVAVVTGAGSGIGRAIARLLAAAGAHVVIVDRDSAAAGETVARIGSGEAIAFDIATGDAAALIDDIAARHGRLDILVNNAGVYPMQAFDGIDDAVWDLTIAVNLRGPLRLMQAAARHMQRGARIVNISSIESLVSTDLGLGHYAASKGGLNGLTRSAAVEWGARGIRVNAVLPGVIAAHGVDLFPAGMKQQYEREIPLGRIGEIDDIAGAVLFLAGPLAAFVSGQTLVVDGGMTISR